MLRTLLPLVVVSWLQVCNALVSQSTKATLPSQSTSFVELVEPETNCRVVLLGCLHGSVSSASDVRSMWNEEEVDAVVLELCPSRVADLRRQAPGASNKPSIPRFIDMVIRTGESKGWTTGAATAVLGGASILQTALSGFEPGLEFTTALEMASSRRCDVVLADQTVDETLRRVGTLPSLSLSMLRDGFPKRESEALQAAIMGDDALRPHQVNMGKVLTRNAAVREDLIRLTLPPLLLAQVAVKVLNAGVSLLYPQQGIEAAQINWWDVMMDLSLTPVDVWRSILFDGLSSVLVLVLGYIMLALPATRVILCERDDQLTEGIRAACRVAASKKPSGGGRVVAVLGLLHVNGVAKQLLTEQKDDMRPLQ